MATRPANLSYKPAPKQPAPGAMSFDGAIDSYGRQLYTQNKSPQTIERVYLPRLRAFSAFLRDNGMPSTLEGIRREHVESYVLHLQQVAPSRKRAGAGQMPATVSIAFRTLRGFFNWAVDDDELARSPMEKMKAPTVPEEPVPVLREADFERLLKKCAGTSFNDRRDTALLRVLFDTGMRRGELAALKLDDVDWTYQQLHISAESSKSKRGRAPFFGRKAGAALDRYIRARARHAHADEPWLWLGERGRLGDSGILQVLERRGRQAGIVGLHPHLFRHTFAHNAKAAGLTSEDVALLGGWRDLGVMARYGRGAAAERAIAAYRLVVPGDRIG